MPVRPARSSARVRPRGRLDMRTYATRGGIVGMMWTAPEVERIDPPRGADEHHMLAAFLDYQRATLLKKCAGLTDTQMKQRTVPPSRLSLLGLIRHLTDVENGWFADFAGRNPAPRYSSGKDPDGDFEYSYNHVDASAQVEAFLQECQRSRETVCGLPLDYTVLDSAGRSYSLRWVYLHMIEEYARHNGHADLLRERLDGATGD
jgi:hypothetical protein